MGRQTAGQRDCKVGAIYTTRGTMQYASKEHTTALQDLKPPVTKRATPFHIPGTSSTT